MKINVRAMSNYISVLCGAALLFAAAAAAADESLRHFVARAQHAQSVAIVLIHDGKHVAEYHAESGGSELIDLRGATQSVVALGVGLLLRDGFIESLDAPVHRFFPEWNQGRKQFITLRMLLNQTAGLPNAPSSEPPDTVRFALAAELQGDPGSTFLQTNLAANLLLAVIAKASNKPADEYFANELFAPLGIHGVTWQKDAMGNVLGASGLAMTVQDAAAVGELVLQAGRWNDQQIIPETYINELLNPQVSKSVEYGLLWTRTPAWIRLSVDDSSLDLLRQLHVPESDITKIATLKGHAFDSSESLVAKLREVLSDEQFEELYRAAQARAVRMGTIFHLELGPMAAFSASGEGQFIVVVPSAKVVAVRQTLAADDQYDDFVERVLDVSKRWSRLNR
jgi:CubicO group peptidase (beta-lactamase class C family)